MRRKAVGFEVSSLERLGVEALRARWRECFHDEPPKLRSADLLRRVLAERIQMLAHARDPDLERELERLARNYGKGVREPAPKPKFRPGTILLREHEGTTHRVEVKEDGFSWNGRRFDNLSQIAREITGVRWNGPRFFGLRERAKAP